MPVWSFLPCGINTSNFCNQIVISLCLRKQNRRPMKKILLQLLLIFTAVTGLNAQSQVEVSNCYNDYYKAFRDRGAKPVPDGSTQVVVAIRKDGMCSCLMGIITVRNGVPVNDLLIAKEDSSYIKFAFTPHTKYTTGEANFTNFIANGMSPTYYSSNEELINLFFIKYLNDKPAKYVNAPPIK